MSVAGTPLRDDAARAAVQPSMAPPKPYRGRAMSMFDALAVWASIEYRANLAHLNAVEMRVLHAVLNQSIRYQRTSVRISRSRIAHLAAVQPKHVGGAMKALANLGFLAYQPGDGRVMSSVTVTVPEGWERHEQDDTEGPVPAVEAPETGAPQVGVSISGTPEVSDVGSPGASELGGAGTPELASSGVPGTGARTGREYEEKVTRSADGEGPRAAVVALRAAPDAPSPSLDPSASAAEVASSFFEAMKSAGAPVVNTGQVTQGIEDALKAGYDATSVMLGLGFWVAEGDMYPRQIGERCQRAALAGGPPRAATVEALLRQGAQRHAIVVSKRQALSSKTVREAMTMQASTQWQRKPKGMNPWA